MFTVIRNYKIMFGLFLKNDFAESSSNNQEENESLISADFD
jgi:hypothetical protein